MNEAVETLLVEGVLDAIDGRGPQAVPFCSRFALAGQELGRAGASVWKE
jgi:hypothetical protein